MATLNFPDAPDTGDIYFDSNSGFTYEWNGEVWISRGPSTIPSIKELDNISGSFNGSTTTFNLTASSVAVSPANPQQLVINIGNVLQNPGDDYTVSGSTITFTTAPLAGYAFQGTVLGNAFSLGTVDDGTVSPSSFDTSDSYNIGGITVTGITTVTDFTLSGITTVANLEPADVKVSGIGTVSNVIMTKDSAGLGATMGSAVGVVTYYGDGSNLTGLGLSFFPISYDPGISSTSQPVDTNITVDWNHPVKAGSGTITIREGSVSGTVVDQFVVGSSSSISFVNNQVILNPAENVGFDTSLYINFPAGSVKQYGDLYENSQVTYSFDTAEQEMYLWMWGYGGRGNLGQSNTNQYSSPVQIPGTNWSRITTISSTYAASFAFKGDGTAWSWGHNNKGQLGQNNTTPQSSPIQVGTETTWSRARGGNTMFIATKTDGTLWTWGTNPEGGLGHNDQSYYKSPKQLPGTDWVTNDMSKIGASEGHMFAFKTNGSMWVWGNNYNGCLGQNSPAPTHLSSPTQLSGTTWKNAGFIGRASFGVKTNGTLWVWGSNAEGQLGQTAHAAPFNSSSPMQIGTGTDWDKIMGSTSGGSTVGAIKTDGTLWMWGKNNYGGCGINDNVTKSSPVQVPGTTWTDVESGGVGGAGAANVLALKTDGTLWAWGVQDGDQDGGLGQNNVVNYSSPTQISASGTNTWSVISAGQGYGAGIQAEG